MHVVSTGKEDVDTGRQVECCDKAIGFHVALTGTGARIAHVALPAEVAVPLRLIGVERAVVAGVTDTVRVAVCLVRV